MFEAQADAFYTSGLLLDDGVIDPRDTRAVLAFCLDTCAEAKRSHCDRCSSEWQDVKEIVMRT